MTSRLPDDPPKAALIQCRIDGLEVDTDWPTLKSWLQSQARFNQLCAKVVTPPHGVAIELRLPIPQTAIFVWRDYVVEATGFMGEIHITAHKATDDEQQSVEKG